MRGVLVALGCVLSAIVAPPSAHASTEGEADYEAVLLLPIYGSWIAYGVADLYCFASEERMSTTGAALELLLPGLGSYLAASSDYARRENQQLLLISVGSVFVAHAVYSLALASAPSSDAEPSAAWLHAPRDPGEQSRPRGPPPRAQLGVAPLRGGLAATLFGEF